MMWVVLTGIPASDIPMIVPALTVSAANPWTGRSRVILEPIVFTIRQPPKNVPSAIAVVRGEDHPDWDRQVVGVDPGTEATRC